MLARLGRNQVLTTPAAYAAGVFAIGILAHYLPLIPVLLCLAATTLACGSAIDRHGGDHYFQGYLYALLATATITVLVIRWTGWAHLGWVLPILVGVTALLSVPWWRDNRRRTKVILERTVDRWPTLAAKLSMPGVRLVAIRAHAGGNFEGRLEWDPGTTTLDEVLAKHGRIEGGLDLPVGTLRMPPNGRDSNSVLVKAFITDIQDKPILWQPQTEIIDGEHCLKLISVLDAIELGPQEDGLMGRLIMADLEYGARSMLVAGMKGSGKSSLLNLLVAHRVCAIDAFPIAIDLKGGMELGPWRKAMGLVVTTFNDAVRVVQALEDIVEARAAYCADNGIRVWPISPEHPLISLIVDECHSLNGVMNSKQIAMLERITQKSRALGIEIVEATQYPTLASLRSNLIREQLDQRMCFRMQDSSGEAYVFGTGRENHVGAHRIPQSRPGTCYHQSGEKLNKMPLRIFYVDDETVRTLVELRAGHTCPLDEMSWDILVSYFPELVPGTDQDTTGHEDTGGTGPGQPFGTTRDSVPGQPGTDQDIPGQTVPYWDKPDVPIEDIVSLHWDSLSPEQQDTMSRQRDKLRDSTAGTKLSEDAARDKVRDTLQNAGTDGVRAKDLATAATRSSSWLYPLLSEWREQGLVAPTRHGHWAWCGSDRPVTVQSTVQ